MAVNATATVAMIWGVVNLIALPATRAWGGQCLTKVLGIGAIILRLH